MDKHELPPASHELVPRKSTEAYPGHGEAGSYLHGRRDEFEHGGFVEDWRILCRQKDILAWITFLGALAGVLLTICQSPVYRARTALEIQNINEDFLNIKQVNPVSEGDSSTVLTEIATQVRLLQSESLIKRVLTKLRDRFAEDPKVKTSRFSLWRKAVLPELKLSDESGAVQAAAESLKARASGLTRVVEASYDSTDPRFAAAFLNTLVQELMESNMEARMKSSEYTSQWLSRQLEDMRIKLEHSEDALQSYARSTGLIFTSEKTNISEEKLRQLQGELSKTQADRITAQSRWQGTTTSPPDALPDVLNDSSLRSLQEKLTELRRQKAELITIYTEKHNKVKQVEAQIASLEAALQKERTAIVDRIRNDYETALRREKLLSAEYRNQSRLVTDQDEKSIQYGILKREVDSNRGIYEAMLQRVKEANIASAVRATNVRIIDAAEPPKRPYKPSLPVNAAVGLLSGLCIGVAFLVTRGRADRTLRAPGEAQLWLNVPELQVIPTAVEESGRCLDTERCDKTTTLLPSRQQRDPGLPKRTIEHADSLSVELVTWYRKASLIAESYRSLLTSILFSGSNGLPERTSKQADSLSVELVTWYRKASLIAESYRSLLTSILFSGSNGDCPRVLVLTSAGPKEGKTTVATNLGIALAETKRKVLIIDGDLRKPRMHELFDLPNGHGLSSLLRDPQRAVAKLSRIVQETKIPGLFVLTSGPLTKNAADLLHSADLSGLVAKIKLEFDFVIIDTPPMLQMADARVLGRMADAIILVTRAGQTTRDAAEAATWRFTEDNTRVLGTVLNGWDPKETSYYGYRYPFCRYHY